MAHVGKEVAFGPTAQFRQQLFLPPVFFPAQDDLVNQGYDRQHDQDQNQAGGPCPSTVQSGSVPSGFQKVRGRKGLIYCTCYVVFLHQQLVIVVDPNYGTGRHGMEGLLYPYHGSNDDQGRHPHPAGSGLTKAAVPVVLQKIQEEQAAYDSPEDEDNIGLRFQPGGHVFNRQEQEQSEKYGADTA